MRKRSLKSGGQAVVMVALALVSMMGIIGLAVDLGWSFFVKKQAQSAADGAALAAVQEAMTRLRAAGSVSGFTCAGAGTGSTQTDCESNSIRCGSVASSSNLHNGCLYAQSNGFDDAASRQKVYIQSNDGKNPPNPDPNVKRISYWVKVTTIQTIPQLFSAVLGNSEGTVSAVATAGIVGAITPGNFFGMNRVGDCIQGGDCGLDFITGHGKGKGSGGSQACGPNGITSDFCAPAGIVLASSCGPGGGAGCSQNYAGNDQGAGAVGSSLTVMGPSGAVQGTTKDLSGGVLTATHSTDPRMFQDPTAPNPQPPLGTSGSSIGTCAIPHAPGTQTADIPADATLGPYLYYSYSAKGPTGKPSPDGVPITVSGTVGFSPTASCPTASVGGVGGTVATAGTQTYSNFPTYMFLGGLVNNGTMTVEPGQYVMAGTNSTTGSVFTNNNTVISSTSAQSAGSMFIFTDAAYPGMNLLANTATNFSPLVTGGTGIALNQGTVDLSNNSGGVEMYGIVNSAVNSSVPSFMNPYTGVVWWQDRRNSVVGYNEASGSPGCGPNCTKDDGSVIYCAIGCSGGSSNPLTSANHVTATSPGGVQFSNGNTKIALNGVYYQPRGAWTDLSNGNTGFNCPATGGQCQLQIITGALIMGNGNGRMVLAGPTNPLLTYKAALIQ